MEAIKFLKHFAQKATPMQNELFADLKREANQLAPVGGEMVEILADFARRGKWIRGALTVLGYNCGGGKENKEILKVGVAQDLIHSAVLIADDIMDRAELRRGKPTAHRVYERLATKYGRADATYFGISLAVNLSLTGLFFAEHIFAGVALAKEKVARAQSFLNRYLVDVCFGQGMDAVLQQSKAIAIDDVLRMCKLKTAYYTIAGPLKVGGILGGAGKEQLQAMENYGLKVGVAFQLRDDELGLFGEKGEIGKSVYSDLKEGKNTILFVKAFEKADLQQHKVLERAFGNTEVTNDQLQAVREIVVKTGALQFSQDICNKLLKEGKSYIPQISDDGQLQETLYNLADFMVRRDR